MARPTNRISRNGKAAKRQQFLGTVTREELEHIRNAQQLIVLAKRQVALLGDGLNLRWKALGDKYGLPAEFNFDTETGEILTKE